MGAYFDELLRAMSLIAEQPGSIFVGQAVGAPGTAMRRTLEHLPPSKLLEFPVAEDVQMGFCTGLALGGWLPVCVYPRINFMLLAMSQLVLHLDKLPLYSAYRPKVIVRTAIATDQPLDPGPQHLGDYVDAIKSMLRTVDVFHVVEAEAVVPAYEAAIASGSPTVIVEEMRLYA